MPPSLLRCPRFDDTYFNAQDGLAEKDYVYVRGNDLPARWAVGEGLVIAELGFGVGLGMLATALAWQAGGFVRAGYRLQFTSIEGHPLPRQALQDIYQHWPLLQHNLDLAWLNDWPAAGPENESTTDLTFSPAPGMMVQVLVGEVATRLAAVPAGIEAWYLDGFAPAKNPAMWGPAVWAALATRSAPGATASTYSVARVAKDGLTTAGFTWAKHPGFGHKAEMLRARRG